MDWLYFYILQILNSLKIYHQVIKELYQNIPINIKNKLSIHKLLQNPQYLCTQNHYLKHVMVSETKWLAKVFM